MRVLLTAVSLPLVLCAGLVYQLHEHPTGGMPAGTITIAAAPPPAAAQARTAPVTAGPVMPVPTSVAAAAAGAPGDVERLATLVVAAKDWLGTPYDWGGCSHRGVDCSCFVQHAYEAIGISVPRTTVTQAAVERAIAREDIRVGDSIFYDNTCTNCGPNPTHVGMYLGSGLQIDAGDPVRIEPVFWNKLHSIGRPAGL